jgi:transcriptional regulator with XRE-family HTH domain
MDKELDAYKETSEKVKHFRRICGLSQEGLAQASGISIRTIQRIEKGVSIGNAYTISALAKALNINNLDLLPQQLRIAGSDRLSPASSNLAFTKENSGTLKLLNLSAVCVIVIPLSNVVLPAIIFWRNRDNEAVNSYGRKILSFQLLWVLFTLLMMITIPSIMLLLFEPLRRGGIPLSVPIYFTSVLLNVCLTIRFAFDINQSATLVKRLPNIL